MTQGITLTTDTEFNKTLYNLPPPSNIRYLSGLRGESLEVSFYFEHKPQSWREWQRIASIKIQMLEQLPFIKFKEFLEFDNVTKVYSINELGVYYPKFIKYQKPLYPTSKDDFMRCLTLYTQRLHYEKQLHYEGVQAMALHFNSKCKLDYSLRQVSRKAKSVYLMDRSKWKVKLSEVELKKAHSRGGLLRVEKKRAEFSIKRDEAIRLRSKGMILKDIAIKLNVSYKTIQRWKLSKPTK